MSRCHILVATTLPVELQKTTHLFWYSTADCMALSLLRQIIGQVKSFLVTNEYNLSCCIKTSV